MAKQSNRHPISSSIQTIALFSALGAAVLIGLTGCNRTPDCADAIAAASALGSQGQLADFEAAGFEAACQSEYLAAWEDSKNAFCDPQQAFSRAMAGSDQPPACEAPAYRRNHQLGSSLHQLLEEKRQIAAALATGENDGTDPMRLQTWRMRLRVLEREIPELETIARMRGLMAPAELPPEVQDPQSNDER